MKARFKAMRERTGMTVELVAKVMGVTTAAVEFWEDPGSARMPTDEAMRMLENAVQRQRELVQATMTAAADMNGGTLEGVESVSLPYWLTTAAYDELSDDAAYGLRGNMGMSNANAIATEITLEAMGVRVDWVDMER